MWGQIAGAAIGALGGALGGGGGTEKTQPMEYIPRFLRDDYERLAGSVEGMAVPEYYNGNQIAGLNPNQLQAWNNMAGYGAGMGGDISGMQFQGGASAIDALTGGLDFLNQNQGYQPMEFRQDLFDNTMSNLMPGMQAQFDSGARDLTRGFTWNTLPGLNMEAAMAGVEGGNTKLGQQTALGQARTQENIADYGMGLYTNALNQAQSAGMTGGQTDAGNFLRGVGQTLQGYGQFGNMGNNLLNSAWNTSTGNLGLQEQAGMNQFKYDQSLIDADMAKWNFEQNAPMAHLQQQLSLLPGPGQPVQGTPGMSPWEGAFQGAMGGMGLYDAGQNAGWWGQQPISPTPPANWNPYGSGSDYAYSNMIG